MIAVDDLIALVRHYNPRTDEALIRDAYAFGHEMHAGQTRHSGEPYFTHPVAVAAILTEQRLDDATIVTALLHDTVEDTKASYRTVEERFGPEIAELVDGVTKLTNLQLSSSETKQAENFRKLFMAMSRDLRVILVKLADRLHNMRTIRSMRPEKQVQKARETMDIFAPLAGRMGMQWMRDELEDLAFKVLNPEGRASIIRRFITLQKEAGDVIHRITGDMRAELEKTIPGFAERIVTEMTLTPEDFRDRYLSPYGSGFSIEPRILQSAWFRPHNVSEEAEGLYLVGAGTHPGAGVPGVISSAEVLAKLVPDAVPDSLPDMMSDAAVVQ